LEHVVSGPEQQLRAERDQLARHVARLERDLAEVVAASEGSNADDEHDPEGHTIGFERAQLSALLDAARRRQDDVHHALQAVTAGSWGSCERCGGPIGAERLAARPSTRTCVACASLTNR
jgi:RNA polymerase-binding transcription factor DksA